VKLAWRKLAAAIKRALRRIAREIITDDPHQGKGPWT